jgi:hypothetical protein
MAGHLHDLFEHFQRLAWGAIQNQSYLACQNQSTEPSATWQHRVPTMDLM